MRRPGVSRDPGPAIPFCTQAAPKSRQRAEPNRHSRACGERAPTVTCASSPVQV
jgi:hypothetical protein